MLKNLPYNTKKRLLHLYNSIFSNYIPQQFKIIMVVPISKPGTDKTLQNSYRPISLNSCLAKILDKMVANRLWWFVTEHKLLNSRQFGFNPGRSTMDTLLYIDHHIAQNLSRKKHTTIISLDFDR